MNSEQLGQACRLTSKSGPALPKPRTVHDNRPFQSSDTHPRLHIVNGESHRGSIEFPRSYREHPSPTGDDLYGTLDQQHINQHGIAATHRRLPRKPPPKPSQFPTSILPPTLPPESLLQPS